MDALDYVTSHKVVISARQSISLKHRSTQNVLLVAYWCYEYKFFSAC